jgi:hypothetical protein
LFSLISSIYPQEEWFLWKFGAIPKNYWTVPGNQTNFVNWVTKELKIKDIEDWYRVTVKDWQDIGLSGLIMKQYNNSPSLLVSSLFPDYNWLPWKFVVTPRTYWREPENIKKFMDWAGKELGVIELKDWYIIPTKVGSFLVTLRF